MANDLTLFQQTGGELAPQFANMPVSMDDDLAGGVGGNYGIISMRGKVWRVKHQGNEHPVLNEKGEPVGSLEVVIVKANPHLTKQFYAKGYEEGDSSAPDCYSLDGVKPADEVENKQHSTCALCPQNRFGSRITPSGSKAKACQDNRKLAVVPLQDLRNEQFGGPMLLRIPASALKDLATFGAKMKANGYPYNAIATRIGFELEAAYPKPTFRAIRPLTGDEADVVLELFNSDLTERVLADFAAPPAEAEAMAPQEAEVFEQPQPQPQPTPARTVAKPAAPAAAKPAPAKPAVVAPKPAAVAKPAPAKPKPVVAAPPPVAAPEPAVEVEEAVTEGAGLSVDQSIEDILAELNSAAE